MASQAIAVISPHRPPVRGVRRVAGLGCRDNGDLRRSGRGAWRWFRRTTSWPRFPAFWSTSTTTTFHQIELRWTEFSEQAATSEGHHRAHARRLSPELAARGRGALRPGNAEAGPARVRARLRVAWGLADQILSSASNFLVAFLAAAALSASNFGSFALALAVCSLVVYLARGLASDPLSAAHAADDGPAMHAAIRASATTALCTSFLAALGVAATGLLVGGNLGAVLLVAAVVLPGVALQDNLRYALLVARRPKAMFLNDLLWLVLQIPLLVLVVWQHSSPTLLMAAWGVAGNVAAVAGLMQTRVALGSPTTVGPWLRRHRHLWPFFVLDNLVLQATNVALLVILSLLATLSEVGGARAALLLYTPMTVLARGVVAVVVPEFARHAHDPVWVRRRSVTLGVLLVPVTLAWTLLMALIPDGLGRTMLGQSWEYAEPLVVLAGLTVAVAMFSTGSRGGDSGAAGRAHGFQCSHPRFGAGAGQRCCYRRGSLERRTRCHAPDGARLPAPDRDMAVVAETGDCSMSLAAAGTALWSPLGG